MKSEDRSVAEQPPSPPNLSGRRSVLSRTYRLPREEHRCATAAQRRENTARRRYVDAEDDFPVRSRRGRDSGRARAELPRRQPEVVFIRKNLYLMNIQIIFEIN